MSRRRRLTGTVEDFREYPGYGFIRSDDGKRFFVHYSFIESDDSFKYLEAGDRVIFTPGPRQKDGKAPQARNVQVLHERRETVSWVQPSETSEQNGAAERSSPSESAELITSSVNLPDSEIPRHKSDNPFTTRGAASPEQFVGRDKEVEDSVKFIADCRDVIVGGDRGIGKSWLLAEIAGIVKAEPRSLKRHNIDPAHKVTKFAVGYHLCLTSNTAEDIMEGLVEDLTRTYFKRPWRQILTKLPKLGLSLGWMALTYAQFGPLPIEVKFKEEDEGAGHGMTQARFYEFIEKFLKIERNFSGVDGIVFIIDEVERLVEKVDFGNFARITADSMKRRGYGKICFVISGADDVAARIIQIHPSMARVAETIALGQMTKAELEKIVRTYLEGTGVKIADDEVLNRIAALANGSPSRLQMLARECYDQDQDLVIDLMDVDNASKTLGAKLETQWFGRFVRQETWPSYKKILQSIAANEDVRLTTDQIAEETQLPVESVRSLCGHLKAGEILIAEKVQRDGAEKQTYRFRNQAAGLYVKLRAEVEAKEGIQQADTVGVEATAEGLSESLGSHELLHRGAEPAAGIPKRADTLAGGANYPP